MEIFTQLAEISGAALDPDRASESDWAAAMILSTTQTGEAAASQASEVDTEELLEDWEQVNAEDALVVEKRPDRKPGSVLSSAASSSVGSASWTRDPNLHAVEACHDPEWFEMCYCVTGAGGLARGDMGKHRQKLRDKGEGDRSREETRIPE